MTTRCCVVLFLLATSIYAPLAHCDALDAEIPPDALLSQLTLGAFQLVSSTAVWKSRTPIDTSASANNNKRRTLQEDTGATKHFSITLLVPNTGHDGISDQVNNGTPVELSLRPATNLFHADFEHHVVGTDGKMVRAPGGAALVEAAETCLFHGHIVGETPVASRAVVSFCDGQLHAVLHRRGHESMLVRPLPSNPLMSVVYARSALDDIAQATGAGTCGVHDATSSSTTTSTTSAPAPTMPNSNNPDDQSSRFADVSGANINDVEYPPLHERKNKVMELLFINSASRHEQWGQRTPLHSAFITALVQNIYDNLPLDYRIWFVISGMVTFQTRDPFEGDGPAVISDGIDANVLLDAVDNWRGRFEKELPRHDLALYLSSTEFSLEGRTNVVGLTRLDSVCTANRTGIVQATTRDADMVASITAHEIGHALGMRHTSQKPVGLESASCVGVMDASVFRQTEWSSCSSAWAKRFFDGSEAMNIVRKYGTKGWPLCLDNAPELDAVWAPDRAVCGNGIVEAGETCDCPRNDCIGINECCDGLSCQLLPSPQCSTQAPIAHGEMQESCRNGVLDDSEADIDCGQACQLPCLVGQTCSSELDCVFPSSCVGGQCVDDFALPDIFQSPSYNPILAWIDQNYVLFIVITTLGSLSLCFCTMGLMPCNGFLGETHEKRTRSRRTRLRSSARIVLPRSSASFAGRSSFVGAPSKLVLRSSYTDTTRGAHLRSFTTMSSSGLSSFESPASSLPSAPAVNKSPVVTVGGVQLKHLDSDEDFSPANASSNSNSRRNSSNSRDGESSVAAEAHVVEIDADAMPGI